MHKQEWAQKRIMSDVGLAHQVNRWHYFNKKIVFTNGCYDILHHGHLDLLAKAADMGDILIVGLNSDTSIERIKGIDRPVNHEKDRLLQMASLIYVDAVCLFEEDTPIRLIESIRPNVLVKGGDYDISTVVGADFVIENGGTVEIVPLVEGYSTSNLIQQIKKL